MAKRKAKQPKPAESKLPPRASYTQINTFQRCKTRYFWKYLLGLEPTTTPAGLLRGGMLHRAYDLYMFREREDHAIAHGLVDEEAQEAINDGIMDPDVVNQVADEAHAVLDHYLPWADENDDWSVVVLPDAKECEVTGQIYVDVKGPDGELDEMPFLFKIDALVQHQGMLMMLENKFRKNLDSNGLEHDLQILAYQAAWNKLHPEHPIEGVIYNIVAAKPRKKDGAVATREFFYRGEREQQVGLRLISSVLSEMKSQEQLGIWPMSPRKECNWDCDFVGMCLGVRAGASVQEYVATGEYRQVTAKEREQRKRSRAQRLEDQAREAIQAKRDQGF